MDTYRVGGSKYLKISWDEVEELVENLAGKIVSSYRFDLLVGVLRGGMIVVYLLTYQLNYLFYQIFYGIDDGI